jgi:hypothetical protein
MSIKRINEFPEGSGSLTNDDVFLFMDDPSGNGVTKKISLSQISSAIGGGGGGSTFDAAVPWTANHTLVDGTRYLANDLVYSSGNLYRAKFDNESIPVTDTTYWENVGPGYRLNIDGRDIPNIPNPFDQNLNTTDFPTFSGVNLTNNSSLAEGSFDSGVGGNGGISLNCTVGYELNWQAGHLRNIVTGDGSGIPQVLYLDSPITYSPTVVSLTFNTTLNTDCALGEVFDVTLTDNVTLANPTNPVNGKTLRWRILQDGNGNRGVTLGDKFVIPSSATSPLPWSTAANKMDIFAATYHSGRDKWDVVAFVPGY